MDKTPSAITVLITFLLTCLWSAAARADYYTWDEAVAATEGAQENYPEIARVYVIGQTEEGREILALKISDNVDEDEAEPEILFDAAIHGDEKTSFETALYLMTQLTETYASNEIVTELVDSREIWIVPVVNPDGMAAGIRRNSNDIDCNRDHGYMWSGMSGSQAPFSQNETRAMLQLASDNQFVLATSFHAGNEVLVFAWSYTPVHTADRLNYLALGSGYGALANYPYMQSATEDYYITGNSKDMYYGAFGTLAWTVEISHEKDPLFEDVQGYLDRNLPASLFLIAAAGQGIGGTVTDAVTGKPLAATIEIIELGWLCYADPEVGDFHRFLIPGDYAVEVRAPGYESLIVEDIEVVLNNQTQIPVRLEPSDDDLRYGYRVLISTMPLLDEAITVTMNALGPPDGRWYSLDHRGHVVIDMGPGAPVCDGPGDDVTVFEGDADNNPEGFEIFAATELFGDWVSLGKGMGDASFDLEGTGLGEVRYFKIEDDNIEQDSDDDPVNPGYDLDAIAGNAVAPDDETDTTVDAGADSGFTDDAQDFADGGEIQDAGDWSDSGGASFKSIDGSCTCSNTGNAVSPGLFRVLMTYFLLLENW